VSEILPHIARYSLYRSLAATTEYQLGRTVRLFGEWLGRPAKLLDLEDDQVSRWLQHLELTYAQRTVLSHRTNLLMVWRDCFRAGLVEGPRRVRRVRKPDPCPTAWTIPELRAVLRRCRALVGYFPDGTPRALYCESLVCAVYDSGLRRSDIWRIRRSQITPTGAVVLRQHKTGHSHYPQLRPRTLALVLRLERDPVLKCPFANESNWYVWWRDNVTAIAGVRHGAMQQLRRTGATQLDIEHPEAVSDYLGHRTPDMRKYYVDRSISTRNRQMPPDVA